MGTREDGVKARFAGWSIKKDASTYRVDFKSGCFIWDDGLSGGASPSSERYVGPKEMLLTYVTGGSMITLEIFVNGELNQSMSGSFDMAYDITFTPPAEPPVIEIRVRGGSSYSASEKKPEL